VRRAPEPAGADRAADGAHDAELELVPGAPEPAGADWAADGTHDAGPTRVQRLCTCHHIANDTVSGCRGKRGGIPLVVNKVVLLYLLPLTASRTNCIIRSHVPLYDFNRNTHVQSASFSSGKHVSCIIISHRSSNLNNSILGCLYCPILNIHSASDSVLSGSSHADMEGFR
jgi:hypothetical protein